MGDNTNTFTVLTDFNGNAVLVDGCHQCHTQIWYSHSEAEYRLWYTGNYICEPSGTKFKCLFQERYSAATDLDSDDPADADDKWDFDNDDPVSFSPRYALTTIALPETATIQDCLNEYDPATSCKILCTLQNYDWANADAINYLFGADYSWLESDEPRAVCVLENENKAPKCLCTVTINMNHACAEFDPLRGFYTEATKGTGEGECPLTEAPMTEVHEGIYVELRTSAGVTVTVDNCQECVDEIILAKKASTGNYICKDAPLSKFKCEYETMTGVEFDPFKLPIDYRGFFVPVYDDDENGDTASIIAEIDFEDPTDCSRNVQDMTTDYTGLDDEFSCSMWCNNVAYISALFGFETPVPTVINGNVRALCS